VKHEFKSAYNNQFTSHVITMTQSGRELVMDSGDCGYLQAMTQDFVDGMAFVISAWHPDDYPDWLQGDRCYGQQGCPGYTNFSISNLKF
jgi:hypothetical protein